MAFRFSRGIFAGAAMAACLASTPVLASHSWNGYHWARTTSSFTLPVIDSTTSAWDTQLNTAVAQWSQSSKLDLSIVSHSSSGLTRLFCSQTAGKIRVCNYSYGKNGWLGLASINLDSSGHIKQGTAKMNDTYSSTFSADPNEAYHVMCQEMGHTFGLDHTSTDGSSQGTCMDYSSSPNSTAPNQHDYDELATIYSHLDSYNSYSAALAQSIGKSNADVDVGVGVPKGVMVGKTRFSEVWAAPDGHGGLWIHHVFLAPDALHTEIQN